MTKEELHAFLRRYTPAETAYIRGDFSEASNEEEFRKYRLLDGNTYLFEGRLFMNSGEKIGVARQDRFNKVYTHKHDYIELCYVWSGSCRQTIEGKEVLTRQGDVCIFDTQAVHSIEAAGEEDLIVNILMRQDFFDTAFLSRMTRQGIVSEFLMEAVSKNRKNKHYLYFPSGKSQRVRDLIEEIMLEYYNRDLGMEEVLESYVIILFTELLRCFRDHSASEEEASVRVQVVELLSYIEEHFLDGSLPEMARHFGFHENYLTTLLREKTGKSYVEHIQELRLKKAESLLENTDLPMTELIPLCGYNNLNFFYKKFKEAKGCTPAEYRKRRQG